MKKKDWLIVIIALVLPLLIAGIMGYHAHNTSRVIKKAKSFHLRKPDPMKCEKPHGIDISHRNVSYDWGKVEVDFCYVRATMGAGLKDRSYSKHLKNATEHNIPLGAYHFLTASTGAKEQFDCFKSVVKKEHLQLRPMLDVEESKYWKAPKGFTDSDAHNFIREWCDLCINEYGVAPIIYTTEKLYQRYNLKRGFDDCIWWVANYNDSTGYEKKSVIPYTLHQYSDKKYVEGFYGHVDCNRFATGKKVEDLHIKPLKMTKKNV